MVGPYELQDFNLFYMTRFGFRPVEDRLPRLARLERRGARRLAAALPGGAQRAYDLADDQALARRLPVPLLRDQPVQALGHAERPEGRLRRLPIAARRLARAERFFRCGVAQGFGQRAVSWRLRGRVSKKNEADSDLIAMTWVLRARQLAGLRKTAWRNSRADVRFSSKGGVKADMTA